MYAIVEIAGFDYKVKPGDRITVPHLPNEPGDKVEFPDVKLLRDKEELKLAPKASVKAKVLAHHRGKKTVVYKFRRRKGYRRKSGYRDSLTELEVTSITHKE